MEGIKYMNLIEMDPVVIEIKGVKNGELMVSVNNTSVRHKAFLAADTRLCVLMCCTMYGWILCQSHCPPDLSHVIEEV